MRGLKHGAQIGPPRVIDRGRYGDDEKIGTPELGRLAGKAQRRTPQIGRIDLAGPVPPRPQLRDTARIDVKANDGASVARKGRRDRQSDITETNDGNRPAV